MRQAERFNAVAGHENRGFLSWSHGFVPKNAPLTGLAPAFAAWDELAAELPLLYRDLSLRRRVHELPLLDASSPELEEPALLRACALLALVAHAYWYVEPSPPEALPRAIQAPWQELRARLERTQEVLTYADLVVYNWQVVDPARPEPLTVENLRLLLPTVGNREESVFYLTQLEILARASSIVRAFVVAHDGVLNDDAGAVERALVEIIDCLDRIVSDSLLKINPNPYSKTYVDPVVWAKSVAPLAVPLHAGDQGPSGTSSPIFGALDAFFRRPQSASFLGREIVELGRQHPPFWREFVAALQGVSVIDFVGRVGRPSLTGALREAIELYAGEHGFLGRHRLKVYGYLELGFKVGRSVTIGGFTGAFKDRTWEQVDGELETSRLERLAHRPLSYERASVERVVPALADAASGVRRVVLDVASAGTRFRVGSRCAVLPENRAALVDKTLRALDATGSERLPLSDEWQRAMRLRFGAEDTRALPLSELLRFGTLRPVPLRVAEALHARTQDPRLLAQIRMGTTERWELWELLELLAESGLEPKALWQTPAGLVDDRLSRLIPPERSRLYSISAVEPETPGVSPRTLELTVGELQYSSERARLTLRPPLAGSSAAPADDDIRQGTASTFLVHAFEDRSSVAFRLERPARFQPPRDASRPLILFAAGTGVAPYRAFVRERVRTRAPGLCWLFLSLRTPGEFLLGQELKAAAEGGAFRLSVAFTREGADLELDPARGFVPKPGPRRRIEQLLADPSVTRELVDLVRAPRDGGQGGSVYICGRSGFATTVVGALTRAFERRLEAERGAKHSGAAELVRQLSGEGRLVFELHTDARPIADESRWLSLSEVAQRNNAKAGYWIILEQSVYDMTEFAELHPGGRTIVRAYAGIDATHAYDRAHGRQPDVDAMREMYKLGRIKPLTFEAFTAKITGPHGTTTVSCRAAYQAWVRALHLVVEMQNAHAVDLGLQSSVTSPLGMPRHGSDRFKLSRAAETHFRFLQNCLKPLRAETLPALWSITRGVFAPDASETWMQERLTHIRRDARSKYVKATSRDLVDNVQEWMEREELMLPLLAAAREEDSRLLEELKRALVHGVQVFEEFETRTRTLGAEALLATCRRALTAVQEYYERLDAQWRRLRGAPALHRGRTSSRWPAANVRRLHESEFWVLDEFPEQRIAVLHRTPLPAASLPALATDNDALITKLREEHRAYGIVVDTREAPLRNDKAFEETMAKFRLELTAHFARTAVLLESALGELQVTRLERDEGRTTFVTRSVSAAFRFAAGGR
jgi:sulfite reductase (NADPH) flavoprotein alpha-component